MKRLTAVLLCLILTAWAPAPFPKPVKPELTHPTAGKYHLWLYGNPSRLCELSVDGTGWYESDSGIWYVIWEWDGETLKIWEGIGAYGHERMVNRMRDNMLYFEYPLGRRLETPEGHDGIYMKLRRRK